MNTDISKNNNNDTPKVPCFKFETTPTADRLRELRSQTKLSQSEFAEQIGIPIQTYSQWETGRRNPPSYVVDMIEKLMKLDWYAPGKHTNVKRLARIFDEEFAAIGCPIPALNRVKVVRSVDELGEQHYYITAGELSPKYIKAMQYWLNTPVDEEYIEEFAVRRTECESHEDFLDLRSQMLITKQDTWLAEYKEAIKEIIDDYKSRHSDQK